jgi:hypothetical protein
VFWKCIVCSLVKNPSFSDDSIEKYSTLEKEVMAFTDLLICRNSLLLSNKHTFFTVY